MITITLLAAMTLPTGANVARARSLSEIQSELRASLRHEATAETTQQRAVAIQQLARIFEQLQADPRLPTSERLQGLHRQLRNRLASVARRLQRQATRPAKVPERLRMVARQIGAVVQGAAAPLAAAAAPIPGGRRDLSRQLVEIIQRTISPDIWDINGGPATIVYWPRGQALVIRAPEATHDQLRQALQDLRAAGGP